jgi:alkyl hydroperoxide reductase subunit AhpC
MLTIGDNAPNFDADTTEGRINFHHWLGDSWGVIFSHPKDFTPVCTTELGAMAKLKGEFDRRGVKIIALSVDPVSTHTKWSVDIEETQGIAPNYPMIGDTTLDVSKAFGMLPASIEGTSEGRTAADNQTVRSVFIIGPDKKIKLVIAYPMATGRNFDEVLRTVDSLQLTAKHKVSTPANWKRGEDVIILPSVSNDDAKAAYPNGWTTVKPYLRIVPQPGVQAVARTISYKKDGIAVFDVPAEEVFRYMSAGNHPHAAFKRHELVGIAGNVVTVNAEIYNPDGSTFATTIRHTLNQPAGVETTMSGGAFDGARFRHTYTPLSGGRTKVDLNGEFPTMAGVSDAQLLEMIGGFFTMAFDEDTETLRTWIQLAHA